MDNETNGRPTQASGGAEQPQPLPEEELLPLAKLEPQRQAVVKQLVDDIDLGDRNSLLFFGSQIQQELTQVSDNMLEGVRNKDAGPASNSLNEVVTTLRGFGAEDLARKPGFFDRLLGAPKPVVKFLQKYENVRGQIDVITDRLEQQKTQLLTDIVSLDRLYDSSLEYFRQLENHIAAGKEKLRVLDTVDIPAAEKAVASARDDLERRVHDLQLTRQVTMQALPSIRLVQENDKGLVSKMQSTIVNTIPLWRQQLAQAITIHRSGEAAKTVKAATDLTNELLEKNADALQSANREVRTQLERGVFDVEVVKSANDKLIATIQESLQIAQEGKERRAAAVQQLEACESELRQTLAGASAAGGQTR